MDIKAAVIWDGDQTLGGNWVSHPDVETPERVLIKMSPMENQSLEPFSNKQKMSPGSAIISSDAAKALNIVQNEQTKVQITAVRAAKKVHFANSRDY